MATNREHIDYSHEIEDEDQTEVEVDWNFIQTTKTLGDITLMLTWNFASEVRHPIMLLAPTFAPPAGVQVRIAVIEMNNAWRWSRDHNNDAVMETDETRTARMSSDTYQDAAAGSYAMLLGLQRESLAVRNKIRTIIEDYIQDLIQMPPAPDRAARHEAVFEELNLTTGERTERTMRLN